MAVEGTGDRRVDRYLPGLDEAAAWHAFDEAVATTTRFGPERETGNVIAAGVRLAVRVGNAGRARELTTARLPLETDRALRAALAASAGMLAVEVDDDLLARQLADRADADAARAGAPSALAAALLRVALGESIDEYLRQVPAGHDRRYPDRLAEVARLALARGVPASDVQARLTGRLGDLDAGFAPSPRAGAALRCALLAMRGADRDAIEQGRLGLAGHARAAYLDAETHLTIGRCLLRLGRVDEARQHGEQAIALLARWPGRHRTRAEEFLASARGAADLTAREIEVLSCLAAGMSNKQVARCPGISIRTVTVHVSNLLRKTRSASRTEAALWAVRHRLADPPGICVRRASGSRKESASRSRERNMTQQRRPVSRRARRPDRAGTAARPR